MITFANVSKLYGGQILFVDASFQVNPGEKVGLVGPNGAGKSTLFRLIVGEEQPDEGTVERPRKLTIGYFRQDVGDVAGKPVLQHVISDTGEVGLLFEEMASLESKMADPGDDLDQVIDRYGEVQARFEQLGGYDLEARAASILAGLGFAQDQLTQDVGRLSGGWKMRASLASILLSRPEVLLLDEPTNYLDLESILWLESFLREYPGAVVMTCHDRDVLNRVVKKIIAIDAGEVRSFSGNFDFFEQVRAQEAVRQQAEFERQQAMLAKEMRFVERFKAHAAKSAQVQSRVKKLEKVERVIPPPRFVERSFEFRQPPRSGDDVVSIREISKRFGAKTVHDRLSFQVQRGQRWAIMGANGAGKTTLLKMIAGVSEPDLGEVRIGASVVMGYYAQHQMEQLDANRTIMDELVAHAPTVGLGTLRNLAGAFGFSGDDVDKSISVLSGGEKARVALAKILFDAPNLLILDEPTNHLDVVTKTMLTKALSAFDGTILFVSHDRAFLRALATRVLELSVTDGPHVYPGHYDEYVVATGREAPGMRALN
ncbi:MAG: ABC-F family ATP-binding cassette domain-containing protein [Myxococcales bacterium]|nr:ABC-F family ATP-binding cassette domain-containing protein [Myxococcales bacterium]